MDFAHLVFRAVTLVVAALLAVVLASNSGGVNISLLPKKPAPKVCNVPRYSHSALFEDYYNFKTDNFSCQMLGRFPFVCSREASSCYFDALVQIMAIFNMPLPSRLDAFYNQFDNLCLASYTGTIDLGHYFLSKYISDHKKAYIGSVNGNVPTSHPQKHSLTGDPYEVLVVLLDEFAMEEKTKDQMKLGPDTILPPDYEYTTILKSYVWHVEKDPMLVWNVYPQGHRSLQEYFSNLQLAEETADNLMYPEFQFIHVSRMDHLGAHLVDEFNIEHTLEPPLRSSLLGGICFTKINGIIAHYYTIIREENTTYTDGLDYPDEKYVWAVYDNSRSASMLVPQKTAQHMLDREAHLLFYVKEDPLDHPTNPDGEDVGKGQLNGSDDGSVKDHQAGDETVDNQLDQPNDDSVEGDQPCDDEKDNESYEANDYDYGDVENDQFNETSYYTGEDYDGLETDYPGHVKGDQPLVFIDDYTDTDTGNNKVETTITGGGADPKDHKIINRFQELSIDDYGAVPPSSLSPHPDFFRNPFGLPSYEIPRPNSFNSYYNTALPESTEYNLALAISRDASKLPKNSHEYDAAKYDYDETAALEEAIRQSLLDK